MSEVNRYILDRYPGIEFVRYSDYEFLLQRIEALHDVVTGLRAENQRLRDGLKGLQKAVSDAVFIADRTGIVDTNDLKAELAATQESGDETG